MHRPYTEALHRLRGADLRPTRQRMALAKLLFEGPHRHTSAEALHVEAREAGIEVSLATIYNALHQFTAAGMLREVVVDAGKSYFDTNISDHHHFFHEDSGRLEDIPTGTITLPSLPSAPEGSRVQRIDVVIRLRPQGKAVDLSAGKSVKPIE